MTTRSWKLLRRTSPMSLSSPLLHKLHLPLRPRLPRKPRRRQLLSLLRQHRLLSVLRLRTRIQMKLLRLNASLLALEARLPLVVSHLLPLLVLPLVVIEPQLASCVCRRPSRLRLRLLAPPRQVLALTLKRSKRLTLMSRCLQRTSRWTTSTTRWTS